MLYTLLNSSCGSQTVLKDNLAHLSGPMASISLLGVLLTYVFGIGVIINSIPIHSQKCPSLNDNLYERSRGIHFQERT